MPLYRCTSDPDTFDDGQRARIARAITDIHCDLTGAPPTFVHVQFLDANGSEDAPVVLHGGIRAGRSSGLVDELIDRCVGSVSAIGGIDRGDISMRTSSAPASWIFEGGRVFPEPGEENSWMAAHS